jgi:DNA-directed RNA polymerase subunit RPC12/RpoP
MTNIYICQECGEEITSADNGPDLIALHTMGKIWCFCSLDHQRGWLERRDRFYNKPKSKDPKVRWKGLGW